MKESEIVVIGAGMGGLASANLLAKQGFSVILIESHYSAGGCAGYYKTKEGFYDVGATTLSGVKGNRPVSDLAAKLGVDFKLKKVDPGIIVKLNGKSFCFYSDLKKLSAEFQSVFGVHCESTLKLWLKLEEDLWQFLNHEHSFPRFNLFKLPLRLLKYPSLFFKSFYSFMPKDMRENKELIQMIDQVLLISTQQTSKTCPAFMGIIALMYPLDTYSSELGMKGIVSTLEKNFIELGGEILYKCECQKIQKVNNRFLIETNKGEFYCQKVVSNIAPNTLRKMYSKRLRKQRTGTLWGAMVANFAFKSKNKIPVGYYQVHDDEGSLFFSFSDPMDKKRSRDGFQLVSVSTHVKTSAFAKRDKDYQNKKEIYKKRVLREFRKHFSSLEISDLHFESVGTPLTFRYYTKREHGEVGGLIHKSFLSIFRLFPNKLFMREIYFVGEYTFPGQGVVSVFKSALNLVRIIK